MAYVNKTYEQIVTLYLYVST